MTEELKNKETQKKTEKRMPNFNQNLFPNYFPNQPPNINNIKPNMNRNVNPNMNPNFIHNFNPLYQIGMPPFNMPNNSDVILKDVNAENQFLKTKKAILSLNFV